MDYLKYKKEPRVFTGFSELGYLHPESVAHRLREIFESDLSENRGRANELIAIAGATTPGIGIVYEIAKEYGIATLGIVSEKAKEFPDQISKFVDHVLYAPVSEKAINPWEVISPSGNSYMVNAAEDGTLFALGGGEVTVREVEETVRRGIPHVVFSEFEPNPERVARRLVNNPNFNPTPLRNLMAQP
jgi:hypothetical protein